MTKSNKNNEKSIATKLIDDAKELFNSQLASFANAMNSSTMVLDKRLKYTSRKYTSKQIRGFFNNPFNNRKQLQSVSNYLDVSSGNYNRLTRHIYEMPTFDLMLLPYQIPSAEKVDSEKMIKAYIQSAEYLERFDWRFEFATILKDLITQGEFYGYIIEDKENIGIWKLDKEMCRVASYEGGVARIEFNVNFFNGTNEQLLQFYPTEFTQLFNDFKNGKVKENDPTATDLNWRLVSEQGIGFVSNRDFAKGLPMFTGVFEDIIELDDYKELAKAKTELDNYALIHQKAPWKKDARSFKDMLIPLDKLKTFQTNTKKNVRPQIGVVTSPLDLSLHRFDAKNTDIDNVAKAERSIYNSSGVSSFIFNSDKGGGEALKKSLQSDENIVYAYLRQFELLLKRELAKIGTNQYQWKAKLINVTFYSRAEKIKECREDIATGCFKSEYLAVKGYSPMDVINMNIWENDVLKITEKMIPSQSSHTQSSQDTKNESIPSNTGRPLTDNPDEKTEITRDNK